MGKINENQVNGHIVGGYFNNGSLFLKNSEGDYIEVSVGQTAQTNVYTANQISVNQNSDTIVSGGFVDDNLVLTKNGGETITINDTEPTYTYPTRYSQSLHSYQNCDTIVGGSINGDTITLFKKCGDTIVVTGYSNVSYYDGDATTTTTTTVAPTTTTTTTSGQVTTTTTYANQPPNQFSEVNVGYVNGTVTYYFNQQSSKEDAYCDVVEYLVLNATRNSGGSAKKYFGTFQVGTMIYNWQNQAMVNTSGYRVCNIPGYTGLTIITISSGVVQSIIPVGTMHYYNGPNGALSQGEIYDDSVLYGTCDE